MAGVRADPPWREFVRLLREKFPAAHANIIFRHPALERNFITESYDEAITALGDPRTQYVPEDDPIPYYDMAPFKAYRVDEFLAASEAANHPFIAKFLEPFHMGSVLICRVATQTGMQAWISVARERTRGFTKAERERMEAVARMFDHALTLFGHIKEIEDQRDAYERLARAKATGLIRVDYRGNVLHMDRNARAWTGEDGVLRVVGGRLAAARDADRGRFRQALANILDAGSDEELITLETPDGEDMELLIFRTSDPFEPARTKAPRAIVYMRATGHEQTPSLRRLNVLFGLSRREAMLASLIVQGLTVAEAAGDLGISEQTARTYLRQVFEKTGVTRQAELIRKLQASIASVQ